MGKKICFLTILTLLSFSALQATENSHNLLLAPGFEENDYARHWTSIFWKKGGNIVISEEKARSGRRSLKISSGDKNNTVLISQEIAVLPGTYYKLSGWVATVNVSTSGAGGHIGLVDYNLSFHNVQGSHDWTFLEYNFLTAREQTSIRVGAGLGTFGKPSQGTVYFDDMQLQQLETPPEKNIWKIYSGENNKNTPVTEPERETKPPVFRLPVRTIRNMVGLLILALSLFILFIILILYRQKKGLAPDEVIPYWFQKLMKKISGNRQTQSETENAGIRQTVNKGEILARIRTIKRIKNRERRKNNSGKGYGNGKKRSANYEK